LNPALKVRDHVWIETAVRGHFQPVVAECMNKQAVVRLTRDHGWPGVSAAPHAPKRIEVQASFEFLSRAGVAFEALLLQNRLNPLGEQPLSFVGFCADGRPA
jgi:hypothetical protein